MAAAPATKIDNILAHVSMGSDHYALFLGLAKSTDPHFRAMGL